MLLSPLSLREGPRFNIKLQHFYRMNTSGICVCYITGAHTKSHLMSNSSSCTQTVWKLIPLSLQENYWLGCCKDRMIESWVTGWSRVAWPIDRESGCQLTESLVTGWSRVRWPVDWESGGWLFESQVTDWLRVGSRLIESWVAGWSKVMWPRVHDDAYLNAAEASSVVPSVWTVATAEEGPLCVWVSHWLILYHAPFHYLHCRFIRVRSAVGSQLKSHWPPFSATEDVFMEFDIGSVPEIYRNFTSG